MIRNATLDDVTALVELGALMHAESNFSSLPYRDEAVATMLRFLIESPLGCALVYERDGALAGFIVGSVTPAWFSDTSGCIASDLALYVQPKLRHSAAAILLVSNFVDWARGYGAQQIRVGTAAGDAGQAANTIYERLGFQSVGKCFLMDLT